MVNFVISNLLFVAFSFALLFFFDKWRRAYITKKLSVELKCKWLETVKAYYMIEDRNVYLRGHLNLPRQAAINKMDNRFSFKFPPYIEDDAKVRVDRIPIHFIKLKVSKINFSEIITLWKFDGKEIYSVLVKGATKDEISFSNLYLGDVVIKRDDFNKDVCVNDELFVQISIKPHKKDSSFSRLDYRLLSINGKELEKEVGKDITQELSFC